MLRSCSYCGGIHDRTYQCASKPKRFKKITHVDKFRRTQLWIKKRKEIAERDKQLCQICLRERYNTTTKYNFTNLEVHHIVPVVDGWDKRLDDYNLISLCAYHHHMAERGDISAVELKEIAYHQECSKVL